MIFVEPTPCGREVFGSLLLVLGGKPVFLYSSRWVPDHTREQTKEVINHLAREVMGEIISQASQIGLTGPQVTFAMGDAPSYPFERKKAI